jgi:predicted protein tyrosine phosphatase
MTIDISKVDINLYQGSVSCLTRLNEISVKFSLIVICAKDSDIKKTSSNSQIIYTNWVDDEKQCLEPSISQTYDTIKTHLFQGKNVLIICQGGNNMSSAMSIYVICKMSKEMTVELALIQLKKLRPLAKPSKSIVKQLKLIFNRE